MNASIGFATQSRLLHRRHRRPHQRAERPVIAGLVVDLRRAGMRRRRTVIGRIGAPISTHFVSSSISAAGSLPVGGISSPS